MPMFDSTKQFPMGMERLKTHPSMKGLYIYLIHLTRMQHRSHFRGFWMYIALQYVASLWNLIFVYILQLQNPFASIIGSGLGDIEKRSISLINVWMYYRSNWTYTFPYLSSPNEDSDMLLNREIFIAQKATIIETSKRGYIRNYFIWFQGIRICW